MLKESTEEEKERKKRLEFALKIKKIVNTMYGMNRGEYVAPNKSESYEVII